jgi:hypothetical protein
MQNANASVHVLKKKGINQKNQKDWNETLGWFYFEQRLKGLSKAGSNVEVEFNAYRVWR